eukprot:2499369-Rhodomonas_salina.3
MKPNSGNTGIPAGGFPPQCWEVIHCKPYKDNVFRGLRLSSSGVAGYPPILILSCNTTRGFFALLVLESLESDTSLPNGTFSSGPVVIWGTFYNFVLGNPLDPSPRQHRVSHKGRELLSASLALCRAAPGYIHRMIPTATGSA